MITFLQAGQCFLVLSIMASLIVYAACVAAGRADRGDE